MGIDVTWWISSGKLENSWWFDLCMDSFFVLVEKEMKILPIPKQKTNKMLLLTYKILKNLMLITMKLFITQKKFDFSFFESNFNEYNSSYNWRLFQIRGFFKKEYNT